MLVFEKTEGSTASGAPPAASITACARPVGRRAARERSPARFPAPGAASAPSAAHGASPSRCSTGPMPGPRPVRQSAKSGARVSESAPAQPQASACAPHTCPTDRRQGAFEFPEPARIREPLNKYREPRCESESSAARRSPKVVAFTTMPRTGTTRRTILAATLRDGAESASSVVSRLGQSAGYGLRRLPRWRPIQPPSRPRDWFRGSLVWCSVIKHK